MGLCDEFMDKGKRRRNRKITFLFLDGWDLMEESEIPFMKKEK